MRRLAMAAAVGLIALAHTGTEPSSSSGASSAPPRANTGLPRVRSTTIDVARSSFPLPRTVAIAPTDAARDPRADLDRRSAGRERASRDGGAPRPGGDRVWAALAACESGGNPRAVSRNGRYSGAFQFSASTWQSLGYGGVAGDHPYAVQLEAAKRLQARSGWGQWPRCARRLGLR